MTGSPPAGKTLERAPRSARLGSAGGKFLGSLIGDEPVFDVRKTCTKVDVGSWFFKRPVWIGFLDREILLFAKGRRPYAERIPFAELQASEYNHVTGQLILAPSDTASIKNLKLPPLAARDILAHIHGERIPGDRVSRVSGERGA